MCAYMVIFIRAHTYVQKNAAYILVQEDYLRTVSNHSFSLRWYHCVFTVHWCSSNDNASNLVLSRSIRAWLNLALEFLSFLCVYIRAQIYLCLQPYKVTVAPCLQLHHPLVRLPFPSRYVTQQRPTWSLLYLSLLALVGSERWNN
jgi:hypothetical protein